MNKTYIVFAQTYESRRFYTLSLSRKPRENSAYTKLFYNISCSFGKDKEPKNGDIIKIKDLSLSCYETREHEIKPCVYVNDYEVLKNIND